MTDALLLFLPLDLREWVSMGASVAARLGKTILELGGNNAIILTPEAIFKMAALP